MVLLLHSTGALLLNPKLKFDFHIHLIGFDPLAAVGVDWTHLPFLTVTTNNTEARYRDPRCNCGRTSCSVRSARTRSAPETASYSLPPSEEVPHPEEYISRVETKRRKHHMLLSARIDFQCLVLPEESQSVFGFTHATGAIQNKETPTLPRNIQILNECLHFRDFSERQTLGRKNLFLLCNPSLRINHMAFFTQFL